MFPRGRWTVNMRDDFFKIEKPLNEGFSLIETLVAITVLLIAVTGPLSIAHRALSDANLAKNQTIAIFLAQDAIEYLKNLRDENLLSGNDWDRTINDCNGTCIVDSALDTLTACSGSCPVLRQDSATGLYGYNNNWEPTLFTRTVTTTTVNEDEFSVSVDISWQNGTITKTISLKEHILNWHESMAPLTTGLIHLQTPVSTFEATGGTITTDGSYTIHTFTSSGTFNPGTASTSVEVLVVAGGGGGGEVTGGGGAGGGINYSASHAVSQQNYAVTVGAGGAGGDGAGYPAGATGSNSVFDSLTATGGGGGGGFNTACSGNGGGGSSGGPSNGCGTGGDGSGTPAHAAGGGGGDTGAGGDASGGDGNDGGAGGAGTAYSISGSSVTYSGGGGGGSRDDDGTSGSGGAGGGGAGSEDGNAATAGTVNTGGGGGGGSYRQSGNIEGKGGNGGSGIVIIRYVTATGVNSL